MFSLLKIYVYIMWKFLFESKFPQLLKKYSVGLTFSAAVERMFSFSCNILTEKY